MSQYIAVAPAVCTGCRECEVVCSLSHLGECRPGGSAVRCDLCGGKPECVEFCHSGCLTVAETEGPGAQGRLERLAAAAGPV